VALQRLWQCILLIIYFTFVNIISDSNSNRFTAETPIKSLLLIFRNFASYKNQLPAAGYASPATYSVDGKQYFVIACGGGKLKTKSGDK
jgi:glucose dehydrogenase